MELKFVATKKPVAVDVVTQRRQRLIRRIDQQISLIKSATDLGIPRASWVWMDEAGAYLLPIKYGRNPIELKKGMFSIQCDTVEQVSTSFELVRAMVLNGDFDQQLAQASTDIRNKLKKKV
jgi:hypothetical protein